MGGVVCGVTWRAGSGGVLVWLLCGFGYCCVVVCIAVWLLLFLYVVFCVLLLLITYFYSF